MFFDSVVVDCDISRLEVIDEALLCLTDELLVDILTLNGQVMKGARWMPWHQNRRRTRSPAISQGELEISVDPWMSEWGNPHAVYSVYPKGWEPGELKHLSNRRKGKRTSTL